MIGISYREFARREGCNEKLVRRKVLSGHLSLLDNDKLDPALVGTSWRRRPADRVKGADTAADMSAKSADTADSASVSASVGVDAASALDDGGTPSEIAERIVLREGRAPFTKAEAERIKENFLALLRELEYQQKSGQFCSVEEVGRIVESEYSVVRERLIVIPGKLAASLVGLERAEIEAVLRAEIYEALQHLSAPALSA